MLEAIDLRKDYGGIAALQDLNLRVEAGEIFCLLGANGAGKTTTISLFLNFLEPTGGRAVVDGIPVHEEPQRARRLLGYVPEQVTLYGNLTGLENLAYFAALGCRERPTEAALRGILKRTGFPSDAMSRWVRTYSKGMRQKVGIAVALAKQAKGLLLDEPMSGLDPKAANEFSRLLRGLADEGVAILLATHDLFRAREIGHRVGIMERGRLLTVLRTDEIGHLDLERIYLSHMRDG